MIAKLKKAIRVYFGFSSTETNGILFLVPVLLMILYAPSVFRIFLEGQYHDTAEEDKKILMSWLEESKMKIKAKENTIVKPFRFDPNHITSPALISLGFKEKIVSRIMNYRQKGGQFRKKEDLLKIYGINKNLVSQYYDFIVIPKTKKAHHVAEKKSLSKNRSKKRLKTDLNLADTLELQKIRGIGSVLSARLIKYRDALGGFSSMDQVKEVYGIKSDVFQQVSEYFTLANVVPRQVNINQDSIDILARHPYLSYRLSKAIIKYRRQHGDYLNVADLKNIHTVSDSIFNKIAPYMKTKASE
ncbi:MAG: helix-hairpin-helix domain-containing protein [Reichenbachiella sp.]|uniref:ComEA family DNA-binding protein n=1 Tax=Reichenbachiella sp. TaxID=2184521 RepID=UPI003266AB25